MHWFERAPLSVRCPCVAAEKGDVEMLQLLVAGGASLKPLPDDKYGYAPIHWVAKRNRGADVTQALLECGADINQPTRGGLTALHVAVQNDSFDAMRTLLPLSDLQAQSKDGYAAVHHAAMRGSVEAIRLLVESGAEIDNRATGTDGNGWTALHVACWAPDVNKGADASKWVAVVEGLLSHGADPMLSTAAGMTPLHVAARYGQVAIIRKLAAAKGLDLEARDKKGHTAVHYAANSGHRETLELLVGELGMSDSARSEAGKTPLDVAKKGAAKEYLEHLLGAEDEPEPQPTDSVRPPDGMAPEPEPEREREPEPEPR